MKHLLLITLVLFFGGMGFSQTETFSGELLEAHNKSDNLKVQKLLESHAKSTDEYCIPEGMNCSDGDGVHGFALANIDNLASGCSENGYGDFLDLNIELAQGGIYTLQALTNYSSNFLTVWIDFNNDEIFDADERIVSGLELEQSVITETEVSIPLNAITGEFRLRATAVYQYPDPDPCEAYSWGECEDYTATIITPDWKDVSVLEVTMDDAMSTGEITPTAKVAVLGSQVSPFTVTMTDGEDYSSTVTISDMVFGQVADIEFDSFVAEQGTYTFEACTDLAGDIHPENDCAEKEVAIESFDGGVTFINFGATITPGLVTPQVKVTNFSTASGSGEVELIMEGYSSIKTFTNLEANSSLWIDMDPWDATLGEYTLEGCLISSDANLDNNCTEQLLTVIPLEANFIASETVVLTGLNLNFFDKSNYDVTGWEWSFEGGNPASSNESSPQVTYDTPGVYDVELIITHSGGTETITKQDYIEVSDEVLASYEIINDVNTFPIYEVYFVHENLGFGRMGMDFAGKYCKTTDGGDNWEIVTVAGVNKNIGDLHFMDEQNGFLRTSQYGSPTEVWNTTNGGETWEFYAEGLHSQEFRIDAYDNDHVIICGQQSIYDTDMSVTNSGPSGWTHLLSPEADPWSQYQGVQWLSPDSIFAMRFMDANYSYDGGDTWENKSIHEFFNGGWENFGLNAVKFPNDENFGFACGTHYNEGGGIIIKSTDNGQSWDECCRGFDEGRNVHFYDENIGLVTGYNGFVYKTTDGGETWYGTNLNEPNMHEPCVVNENLMFVCVQGKCYRSKNGFFQKPLNKDLMMSEINMPASVILENAPFNINIAVKNVGREQIDTYTLSYQVDNGEVITQEFNPYYLTPNNVIVTDSFNVAWSPVAGEYDIKVWIDLVDEEGDDNLNNDTLIQHVLVTGDYWDNRKVLLEEATGTWCGYCVNGVLTVEAIEEEFNTNKTRVIPVAIHGSDQWEIDYGDEILAAYSGGSYPKGWVDRKQFFGEPSVGLTTDKWYQYTNEQIGINAPMNVEIETVIDPVTKILDISTTANFYGNIESEMRFNCFILEDNLIAPQSNAYNNISGHPYYGLGDPIPDFNHKYVLRAILEDAWGVQGALPNSVSSGDSYEHNFQYTVPDNFELENISVVCFVSKYNEDLTQREVLNANVVPYIDFAPVGVTQISNGENSLKAYPNPASQFITVQWVDTKKAASVIEVNNFLGQQVFKKQVEASSGLVKQTIQLNDLMPGIYYVNVINESFFACKKIVIQ